VTSSFELKRSPDKIEIGDRWLHLWELASGKEALRVDLGKSWHAGLAISPDGRILALAGRGSVEFRDVATGKELLRYAAPAATSWALSFSPGGDRLAAGYADATAMIWDATPAVRRAGPPARDLTARDLDRLWADLAGEDAVKAHDAVWALAAAPGQAVSLVRDRLKPAGAVDPDRVRKLIADLDSRKFEVREAATKELAQIGDRAEPLLRRALQDKPSAEARRRIEEALPHPLLVRSPEMLRAVRAIRVLEQAGTAEARQTLEGLAAGAEGARVTREAKAALERARKR
jgi:hypothetical protein